MTYVPRLVQVAFVMAAMMLLPAGAWAVCTAHGAASTTPTQVVPANDTVLDRRSLFIQNTGSNTLNFAIGTNNKATTADILLAPGASMLMNNYGGGPVPSGD